MCMSGVTNNRLKPSLTGMVKFLLFPKSEHGLFSSLLICPNQRSLVSGRYVVKNNSQLNLSSTLGIYYVQDTELCARGAEMDGAYYLPSSN